MKHKKDYRFHYNDIYLKLKVQMAQENIDCNYKIITFIQKIDSFDIHIASFSLKLTKEGTIFNRKTSWPGKANRCRSDNFGKIPVESSGEASKIWVSRHLAGVAMPKKLTSGGGWWWWCW